MGRPYEIRVAPEQQLDVLAVGFINQKLRVGVANGRLESDSLDEGTPLCGWRERRRKCGWVDLRPRDPGADERTMGMVVGVRVTRREERLGRAQG